MRLVLAATLLVLAGCSSHRAASHDPHRATLASAEEGGKKCSTKAELASMNGEGKKACSAKKAELASMDGEAMKACSTKKAEMASMDGEAKKACSAKKAEMASMDGEAMKACSAKKAEMASAGGKSCHGGAQPVLASAEHAACGACPKKADGTCDHEAGAKAGRECCQSELAKASAN